MDREILLWLAESHRNFHLAGSPLTDSLARALRTDEPWTQGLAYEDFELEYEPRSMARSPDGKRLAVGTKAGFLHLATWNGVRWQRHKPWQLGNDPRWQDKGSTRSIRGVRFLNNRILIAGWGEGIFGIFDSDTMICKKITPRPAVQVNPDKNGEHEWLGRFARFISLVPPKGEHKVPSAVMLGVTLGSHVHVLYRTRASYRANTYLPDLILPEWGKGTRIVDGVWSHGFLWILDSSGHIYRYEPADPARSEFGIPLSLRPRRGRTLRRKDDQKAALEANGIFPLESPREGGEFRCIASCVMGLAVLTSDDITFLRFRPPENGEDVPFIEPGKARWVTVANALDCSVCIPFYDSEHPLSIETTWKNPVWTVVGSSQAGLHWIAWQDQSPRLPAVAVAHRAGTGDSSVLQVRFGFHHRQGPTYVACATRDHRLRITTLLDRFKTQEMLEEEIPLALASDAALARERSIAWWLLWERIRADFDPAKAVVADLIEEPQSLFRLTDRDDLYRLVRWLLGRWNESRLPVERKRQLFQDWMSLILGRSYHIEEGLAQSLAKFAHDRIAHRRAQAGEKGRQVEEQLGLFAAFLRKWVIYGHTYGEKTFGLLQLYDWNARSGHVLDALNYLTRLLRRRIDPLWEAHPIGESPSGVWDVAAPPSGEFSIQSSTDGRIYALDSQGDLLRWYTQEPMAAMNDDHCLNVSEGQLRHSHADEFFKTYRHGPYARSLLLTRVQEGKPPKYLLVFCLRGWRPNDLAELAGEKRERRRPRLVAMIVAKTLDGMGILAVASRTLPGEIYGLCELKELSVPGISHLLVAGTKGAWRSSSGWEPRPFLELAVDLKDDGIQLDLEQKTSILSDRKGQRSVFSKGGLVPETAGNPCWSVTGFTTPDAETWLWAGFHDGFIRCYRRDLDREGRAIWIEGGGLRESIVEGEPRFTHEERSFQTTAPVWRLHVNQQRPLLAYGSADGVVGMVSLDDNMKGPTGTRPHWIHQRESSPISALLSYTDPEEGARLLALTQGGVVVLFELEKRDVGSPEPPRFPFMGSVVDRFALGHQARAGAIVECTEPLYGELLCRGLPAILIGSNEGSVFKYALALPQRSTRRKTAFRSWCSRLLQNGEKESGGGTQQPPLQEFVGEDVLGWLRVLDVRGVHLLRFSIAHQLRTEWPQSSVPQLADKSRQDQYLACLRGLADDVYGRRPLTPEPAKVIWEEAAKMASWIARRILDINDSPEREGLLEALLALTTTVDDLCNRWIGSEQAVESRVLIHIFNCLFNWVGVVLIGLAEPPEKMVIVRRFLLHNIIQRRLNFNDRLVYLETLRNINSALITCIHNACLQAGEVCWCLSLRPSSGSGDAGLYDLLTMVGDLGEQHSGSLTLADPLWTELARFFAASLLLLPRNSYIISQVVAESRLTERDTRFAGAVLDQAEVILSHLATLRTAETARALQQFEDSFNENIDDEIGCPPAVEGDKRQPEISESWRRILGEASKVDPGYYYDDFSNEVFLLDHAAAILTAAHLIWLSNDSLPETAEKWLEGSSRYFEHSRVYLNSRMIKTWAEVKRATRLHEPGSKTHDALTLCEKEIEYLENEADLFEPQRTQYIKIVIRWKEQVWKRAEDAIDLLDILDKFNRHTYRTSSDRLMSGITELAFQTSPLWLDLPDDKPLRNAIETRLDSHALVRDIFDSGNRLVASTHLAGTLFTVARDFYLTSPAPAPRQTSLKDIERELAEFCYFENLTVEWNVRLPEGGEAPGTLAVWDTILQEVVTNVRRYCAGNEPKSRRLLAAYEPRDGRIRLSLAGVRPFIECLDERSRGHIDDQPSTKRKLEVAYKLLEEAEMPGRRLAPSDLAEEGSSGMGLPLIMRICRYLGMQAKLVLRDPLSALGRKSPAEKLRLPLCLEMSWEVES